MPRTKPAVRIHLSIAHHAKTSDAWADLEKRAVIVEILRLAGERYAGRTGNRVSLRMPDRMAAACNEDPSEANRLVEEAVRAVGWRLDRYPNRWDVTIRNFARKQGFHSEESDTISAPETPETHASESESESESESKSERKRESAPRSAAAPPVSGSQVNGSSTRRKLCEKPISFEGEARERIQRWAEGKGFGRETLNAGLDLFREWEPVRPPYRRTIEQWEGAFKRITREAVAEGKLKSAPSAPQWCDCTHSRNDTERATERCRNCDRRIRPRRGRTER